jgi:UDP-glucose 4-epimerase
VKVLVTGGAGFIGSNLVRRLAARGHDPVILDDFSTGRASNLSGLEGIQVHLGCLTDIATVLKAADGAEAIIHLGARGSVPRSIQDPVAAHAVNATGTLNVLEAARRFSSHVVFSSSSSVFGANTSSPKVERSWTQPLSPYGASKLAAESYVMAYANAYDLNVLVLRLFNVFGPWQRPDHEYAAVIPKWLWRAVQGLPLEIEGDGTQSRDFTYVDDVTSIVIEALETGLTLTSPLNLAFGRQVNLNELVTHIEEVLDRSLDVVFRPPRVGDVYSSLNDPSLLRVTFPHVQQRPLTWELTQTLNWLDKDGGRLSAHFGTTGP